MRIWTIGLLLLSGCVIEPLPQREPSPAMTPIAHPLPAPVWPDECVANWYAKTALPSCVESWITDITKQQKTIERRKKKAKAHLSAPVNQ
jgi:hypothetical protein